MSSTLFSMKFTIYSKVLSGISEVAIDPQYPQASSSEVAIPVSSLQQVGAPQVFKAPSL